MPTPALFIYILFKTPRTTDSAIVVLVVAVLVAVVEVLVPRIGGTSLGRAPIVGAGEPTDHNK